MRCFCTISLYIDVIKWVGSRQAAMNGVHAVVRE